MRSGSRFQTTHCAAPWGLELVSKLHTEATSGLYLVSKLHTVRLREVCSCFPNYTMWGAVRSGAFFQTAYCEEPWSLEFFSKPHTLRRREVWRLVSKLHTLRRREVWNWFFLWHLNPWLRTAEKLMSIPPSYRYAESERKDWLLGWGEGEILDICSPFCSESYTITFMFRVTLRLTVWHHQSFEHGVELFKRLAARFFFFQIVPWIVVSRNGTGW
jgi:hypothetical protein